MRHSIRYFRIIRQVRSSFPGFSIWLDCKISGHTGYVGEKIPDSALAPFGLETEHGSPIFAVTDSTAWTVPHSFSCSGTAAAEQRAFQPRQWRDAVQLP